MVCSSSVSLAVRRRHGNVDGSGVHDTLSDWVTGTLGFGADGNVHVRCADFQFLLCLGDGFSIVEAELFGGGFYLIFRFSHGFGILKIVLVTLAFHF